MTVIIGYSSKWFSVLVADRLTTINSVPENTHANKVIVGAFQDGLLAVGYTGPANIAGRPTDDWLVSCVVPSCEKRSGVSYRVHSDIPQFMRQFVGSINVKLRERARSKLDVWKHALEVGFCGLEECRGLQRPYLLQIYKGPKTAKFTTQLQSRPIRAISNPFFVWVSGGWGRVRPMVMNQLKRQVGLVDPRVEQAPDQVAEILRQGALAFADGEPTIGKELATIIHAPFNQGRSLIEFHSHEEHFLGGILADILGRAAPLSYAPWIVGHQTVASPTTIAGSSTLMLRGYPLEIRGSQQIGLFYSGPDGPDK